MAHYAGTVGCTPTPSMSREEPVWVILRAIRQWHGDSLGHSDGDTLVVETKNFSPKSDTPVLA
jgi:hypothetical protein